MYPILMFLLCHLHLCRGTSLLKVSFTMAWKKALATRSMCVRAEGKETSFRSSGSGAGGLSGKLFLEACRSGTAW